MSEVPPYGLQDAPYYIYYDMQIVSLSKWAEQRTMEGTRNTGQSSERSNSGSHSGAYRIKARSYAGKERDKRVLPGLLQRCLLTDPIAVGVNITLSPRRAARLHDIPP